MAVLNIVTHDGTFHTDDVFACATLSLAFQGREIEIIRSREQTRIDTADIVVDVGEIYDPAKNRFDHHQKGGAANRENGIPYASFGLVWKTYGAQVCGSEEIAQLIDERLVQCIDGPDNGVGEIYMGNGFYPYGVMDIISAERPTWQESTDIDESFMTAVNMATHILRRVIAHTTAYTQAKVLLQQAYDASPDKRIIEIGQEYPGWLEFAADHSDILYVIYKRQSDGWSVKAARVDPKTFELRKSFPTTWGDMRAEAFQKLTGVPDAVFCHKGLFIAVAASREGAWALAKSAVES
ncbi:MAG: MYG1 family protein [Candidatus Pacebacteria bacterium]|jgi:uncharacterized UPF0160 family protein|nr:MYG1 family protein [Candidatus Paceibacterota bacterium]MBP9700872.1 MYG1 family protein [Candidatus Paceibacterota bacterium]